MQHEEQFKMYVEAVQKRLEASEQKYETRLFEIPMGVLVYELENELLDILGWGFGLWWRLQQWKHRVEEHDPNM